MQIKVIKNEKNLLEFKLKGERHTFPNLLVKKLQKNKEVVFAAYKLEHPSDSDSLIIVKTKKKNPKKVLVEASKEIAKETKEFAKKASQALK